MTAEHLPNPHPNQRLTTKALIVWGAAVLFYILAITGRTSFGVAGVEAIGRFDVDASRIAVFTAVQVGVYALAQIPVGLLIDRFGARKVLVSGAIVMAIGQITLGFTTDYVVAIGARVLIGAGDATAFLSVMRLLPAWFPPKLTPLFTQLTAGLGQLGQFISAVPFLALLGWQGWTVSFVTLGTAGLLLSLAAAVAISDSPPAEIPAEEPGQLPKRARNQKNARLGRTLATVLREPVCWQAFFIHWAGILNQLVFTLLWGVPLMTLGMGLSASQAGMVLTINTITVIFAGPAQGWLSQRLGLNRDLAVLVLAGLIGVGWLIFFIPDSPRGIAAIIAMNIVMAAFTQTSNFGFDSVREKINHRIVATATGLGNMGGFLSAMLAAQLVGIVLDASAQGNDFEWADFRLAWLAVIAIWAVSLIGIVLARRAMKKKDGGRGSAGFRIIDQS